MVAISSIAILLEIISSAVAFNAVRFRAASPAQTLVPRHDEIGDWSAAPTTPPNPRFAAIAQKRENGGPTCGYYEFNSEPYDCYTNQACVTSGSYFACTGGSSPYTSCLDGFNSICSRSIEGLGTLCCNFNTDYPLCVTALKPVSFGNIATITGFRCGNNHAKGRKLLLETTGRSTSSTSKLTSSDQSSAVIASTVPSSSLPPESSSSPPSSPGPPVGAIVGGTIGGLAVIGLTAGAIAWMLIRNRRRADNNNNNIGPGAGGAPTMTQSYTHPTMPKNGAPIEVVVSPVPTSTHDAYKGPYQPAVRSTVDSVGRESYYQITSSPSTLTPVAETVYQQQAPAPAQGLDPAPSYHGTAENLSSRRVSEVPAINPAGAGNNASELPPQQYRQA
ncbi:uncharacterized protein CTRU02_200587 [Colletotrichum truncatum]|uniref:Uncharacterized protein n=1 Tax=Colletotrichum truncatum TaxID=5467 RepID=A0ACC3ZF18_COLTU|nr:uncharacterized protein CTRU02_00350 [Colletotrichum truncatum]KAF6801601.1 hypothetical protein CTRU02_00350 [Colletotrichum truncatum]